MYIYIISFTQNILSLYWNILTNQTVYYLATSAISLNTRDKLYVNILIECCNVRKYLFMVLWHIQRKITEYSIAAVCKRIWDRMLTSRQMMDMQFKFVVDIAADGNRMEWISLPPVNWCILPITSWIILNSSSSTEL